MLTRELISQSLPVLHLHDKVFNALQMMNDSHVSQLAIDEQGKFYGLISEETLMQAPDDAFEIRELQITFPMLCVRENEHFLKALNIAVENRLSMFRL